MLLISSQGTSCWKLHQWTSSIPWDKPGCSGTIHENWPNLIWHRTVLLEHVATRVLEVLQPKRFKSQNFFGGHLDISRCNLRNFWSIVELPTFRHEMDCMPSWRIAVLSPCPILAWNLRPHNINMCSCQKGSTGKYWLHLTISDFYISTAEVLFSCIFWWFLPLL